MQLDNYQENGVFLAKKLAQPSQLNSLVADIQRVFSEHTEPTDRGVFDLAKRNFDLYRKCAALCQQLPAVHRLGTEPDIISFVQNKLGLGLPTINLKPVLFFSHPRLAKHTFYWKAEAHQDWSGMRGSLNGVVAWLPVRPLTPDMGYLEVSPSSHLWGFQKHEEDGPGYRAVTKDDFGFVPVPMNLGDILFFNTFTMHRSGENTSDKIRVAVNFRFDDVTEQTFRERGYPQPFAYNRCTHDGFDPTVQQIEMAISKGKI